MDRRPEAEPGAAEQLQSQGDPGEEGCRLWQGAQGRHTLHLISAAAQWILLLACLIHLGIDFLRPSPSQSDKVLWTHIRYSGRSTGGVPVNLSAEQGSMQLRDGSILIPCDGLYLVSLRGSIHLEERQDWLQVSLQGTHLASALWEQRVPGNDSALSITTVLYLFREGSVTLLTDCNATIEDLSFSLLLIRDNKC